MKMLDAKFLLAFASIDLSQGHLTLSQGPQVCIEDSDKNLADRVHRVNTCIGWTLQDVAGDTVEHGRITHAGRVSTFDSVKSTHGNQTLRPFGGDWNSKAETLYQSRRWFGPFSKPDQVLL